MALDKNRVQEFHPVITRDHLIDDLADLKRSRLIGRMDFIGTGIEAKKIVGNTQHRVILADLHLDAAPAQCLNCLIEDGAAHLLRLFQLFDFLFELDLPLLQLLLNVHQLQDQDHRGQNEDHQQRRHNVREGHPVRVFLIDGHIMRLAKAHQRASSSSKMPLTAWTLRCI